ncbi:MAG: ATP-binding protein [Oscillospiraceae bacterium]|jgi:AAA15 family ATPase/GTPase|nr:ATP-binding protein [Oscillospiraceae bacterium]
MTIDRLEIKNFLLFTGQKKVSFDIDNDSDGFESSFGNSFDTKFINGINVFIGENATGKSTLLKCIYAACEFSNQKTVPGKARKFPDYFSSSKKPLKEINQTQESNDLGFISVTSGGAEFHYRAWDSGITGLDDWLELGLKSILIPTAEMLSHSNGLIAMSSKYGIPFDYTQIDILVNAQLWETKDISDRNKNLLEMIGSAIGGDVIYEDDTFYVQKTNGLKVEFSLEAEGYRKFGLLWKLIRNGLLESGSILLWDEPEASINPELMPLLVDILYILKNDGIQIFLATHNYMLAKYIDIKKQDEKDVLFISLSKDEAGGIKAARSYDYSTLENNPIEASEENLYNAIVRKSLGD